MHSSSNAFGRLRSPGTIRRAFAIGVLFAAFTFSGFAYRPDFSRAQSDLMVLGNGLEAFFAGAGRYPTTDEGLKALYVRPDSVPDGKWIQVVGEVRTDPWGTEFRYRCPGIHNTNGYDLYSEGRDRVSSTQGADRDDLNNWNATQPWNSYYVKEANRPYFVRLGIAAFVLGIALIVVLRLFPLNSGAVRSETAA